MEEGSTPGLLEFTGLEQALNLINNSGELLPDFGAGAIEWGSYEFKTMNRAREEFGRLRQRDKKKDNDPDIH